MKDTVDNISDSGTWIVKKHPTSQDSVKMPVMWGIVQDPHYQKQEHDVSFAAALHAP